MFKSTPIPQNTTVGCSAYELHSNPLVFPDPQAFRPERWLDATPAMLAHHFPFGAGLRMCIARNLATAELFMAMERLVRAGVLGPGRGARAVQEKVEMMEWFNSSVEGGKIEIVWPGKA